MTTTETTGTQSTSVRAAIVVDTPIEHAFSTFTDGIGSWKPREHNLLDVDIADTVFEPREGGRVYDVGVDGSKCSWASVLAYEPPDRVVMGWCISPQWQIETDPSKISEVQVRFISEAPERTRVEIEHSKLERHGEGWETMRDAVDSAGGWPLYLERFAARL